MSAWSMWTIMTEHGIYDAVFQAEVDNLVTVFAVDDFLRRIDSVHISLYQ